MAGVNIALPTGFLTVSKSKQCLCGIQCVFCNVGVDKEKVTEFQNKQHHWQWPKPVQALYPVLCSPLLFTLLCTYVCISVCASICTKLSNKVRCCPPCGGKTTPWQRFSKSANSTGGIKHHFSCFNGGGDKAPPLYWNRMFTVFFWKFTFFRIFEPSCPTVRIGVRVFTQAVFNHQC